METTIATLGRPLFLRKLDAVDPPRAALARWRHGAALIEIAPTSAIRVAMSLVDSPNARPRGGAVALRREGGRSLSVFAPGEGAVLEVRGEADVLQLFLDRSYAENLLDAPFRLPPWLDVCDDAMRTALLGVVVASSRHAPGDGLKMEQDLSALVYGVARHAAAGRGRTETRAKLYRGGLAPAAARRVHEMIEWALDEAASPRLADMAQAAGLSVGHFVRAFRRDAGVSPHRHFVRRRMDRALSLLRGGAIPIGEVADRAGFSTPAHFVAAFRAMLGVTPGAVRDALSH